MNAVQLDEAISAISDDYLMEFAQVDSKRAMAFRWFFAAACLCLIVSVLVISLAVGERFAPPVAPPERNVIWGEGTEDMRLEEGTVGEIQIADNLRAAFMQSENHEDVFAIRVIEITGASREEVYTRFIQPLGVHEEYMDKGLIFATQTQVEQMHCPRELGVVFTLALKIEDA